MQNISNVQYNVLLQFKKNPATAEQFLKKMIDMGKLSAREVAQIRLLLKGPVAPAIGLGKLAPLGEAERLREMEGKSEEE